MPETPKDPKNMPCVCGSKKKAKHCCLKGLSSTYYKSGQDESSQQVMECKDILAEAYPNHSIIDITSKLTDATYRTFQTQNYYTPVIMIAEKTETNKSVFEPRVNSPLSNMMVLYHGSYRTFAFDDLNEVLKSICDMIK